MKTLFRYFLLLSLSAFLLAACGKDDNNHIEYVNIQINDMMKEVYLWNDYLPRNLDPGSYSTPAKYMEALRYDEYDKWSTVITKEEYNQYFEEGSMIGHGFSLGLDEDGNIRICFLYRGTEPAVKGVKRGWIILKVNGTNATASNVFDLLGDSEAGVVNNITFLDENGTTVNLTLTKTEIHMTPVLHYEIIEQDGLKLGYMVFQDFIETANEELDEVFDSMVTVGIDEMIIDFRYNGGGSVDVAEHLAGWLIGKDFGGQPLIRYQHNALLSTYYDTVYNVPPNANGLSLSRLFFIGTENTASASELVINGMEPFVDVILAGSTTHGKPVGMYVIPIEEYMTLPVCFKYTNKEFNGAFYDGLLPDLSARDDITRDFGNPEEASLKAILDYIKTNQVISARSTSGYNTVLIESKGPLREYLKAY